MTTRLQKGTASGQENVRHINSPQMWNYSFNVLDPVYYRVWSWTLWVGCSHLQRGPDYDRHQGRRQLLSRSHLQSVKTNPLLSSVSHSATTVIQLVNLNSPVWWMKCLFSAVCSLCPETPPLCLDGEILTVDSNTTDRCCPAYQCGQWTHPTYSLIYFPFNTFKHLKNKIHNINQHIWMGHLKF